MKQIFDLNRRPRRLRQSDNIRRMFRETTLSVDDLILPIFIEEGIDKPVAIASMPSVKKFRIPSIFHSPHLSRISRILVVVPYRYR